MLLARKSCEDDAFYDTSLLALLLGKFNFNISVFNLFSIFFKLIFLYCIVLAMYECRFEPRKY